MSSDCTFAENRRTDAGNGIEFATYENLITCEIGESDFSDARPNQTLQQHRRFVCVRTRC